MELQTNYFTVFFLLCSLLLTIGYVQYLIQDHCSATVFTTGHQVLKKGKQMLISRFIRSVGVTPTDARRSETSTQSENLKSYTLLPHKW